MELRKVRGDFNLINYANGLQKYLEEGHTLKGFITDIDKAVIIEKNLQPKFQCTSISMKAALMSAELSYWIRGLDIPKPIYIIHGSDKKVPKLLDELENWSTGKNKFESWYYNNEYCFQLLENRTMRMPPEIFWQALASTKGVLWSDRGYLYFTFRWNTVYGIFNNFSNFSSLNERPAYEPLSLYTAVVKCPESDKKGIYAREYYVSRTGKGNSLWDALEGAFRAVEVEITN